MDEKRVVIALFGVAVAAVIGYVAYRFIAALTVSVFLYYATRRFYRVLGKLRLPKGLRAVVTLSLLAVPLLLLVSYTVVLLAIETTKFVQEYELFELAAEYFGWFEDAQGAPELTIRGIIDAYQAGNLDVFIEFATSNAGWISGLVGSFLLNMLVILIVTYYLLTEGWKAREWVLRYDEDAIVREFLEAADAELEAVLFGNLLNVIVVGVLAIVVYSAYNAFVPTAVEVPYPALAGALTGVASLIPVVGMKIVYAPLTAAAAATPLMTGQPDLLIYVAGFLVLTVVVVDTIPDLFLRPYLSGKRTHVGLLMLAYILGPIVFGFYGLFFAPILLVLGLTFADEAVPRLLGVDPEPGPPESQRRLDEFWP